MATTGTNWSLLRRLGRATLRGMKKRVTAGVLWFFAAWYAWNIIAAIISVSDAPGLVFGVLAALLLAGDPFGRIWTLKHDPEPGAPLSMSSETA